MSHLLVPYTPPAPLRSPILLNPPESVPPTDELEAVQNELKSLRQKALERARKADGDLKAIEVAMKKMREREKGKGKAKAITKVKREPSYTPSLDANERSYTPTGPPSSTHGTSSSASVPIASVSSSLPKVSQEARKVKKKEKDKKRKRDDDSDIEENQRPHKMSSLPPAQKEPFHPKPSKLGPTPTPKTLAGPDWNLPPSHPLLLPRPRPPPPPVPGPSKPTEVTEDFTKIKAPPQTQIQTFYTSIEPWIRNIREEDVGWLEYTADEVEPFIIPPLGRHYTDIWEEEEIARYGTTSGLLDASIPRRSNTLPSDSLPKWDPSTISEGDLQTEKGHGPVTERLLSALLVAPDIPAYKNLTKAEEAFEAKLSASSSNGVSKPSSSASKDDLNVADFENRVRETARYHGLLVQEPDFSRTMDDPVGTALRQAQRQLRVVVAMNKARKARLVDIAKDRLAYQEYLEARDSIDKNITATYSKLQKKDSPKINKKKKRGDVSVNGNGIVNGSTSGVPLPNPASIGLGPDEDGNLTVPDNLQSLVDTRRQWVDVIGGSFEDKQREFPGKINGIPRTSVYEGIEDEIQEELQSLRLSIPPGKAPDDLLRDFRTADISHSSDISNQMVLD